MLTISKEEFLAHFEDDDFFEGYGNPVAVKGSRRTDVLYLSQKLYSRMEEKNSWYEKGAEIKYWVLDFEAGEKDIQTLREIAAENELTPDELLEVSLEHLIARPEYVKELQEEYEKRKQEEGYKKITFRLLREFPVYKGMTEAQARKLCAAGKIGTDYESVTDENIEESDDLEGQP